MKPTSWQLRSFAELGAREMYEIARLRQAVFIVEQNCPYADLDALDSRCLHLTAWHEDTAVAYLRVVPPALHASGCPSIGRVCSAKSARHFGLGRELMQRGIAIVEERYPGMDCQIGAQSYLRGFYESFGFVVNGEQYDEDGILHFPMRREAK